MMMRDRGKDFFATPHQAIRLHFVKQKNSTGRTKNHRHAFAYLKATFVSISMALTLSILFGKQGEKEN